MDFQPTDGLIRFSFISGISLLGTPTEIYIYGIQYLYIMGGIITMGFVMMYVYLPVFHDLKLTSTYQVRKTARREFRSLYFRFQYLQSRFDKKMRLFGCCLFIFSQVWNIDPQAPPLFVSTFFLRSN